MLKANIIFFLNVGHRNGAFIIKMSGYFQGSIPLEPGVYNFWFGGANGGRGADSTAFLDNWENAGKNGSNGGAIFLSNIRIEVLTTIDYYLGERGHNADRGNTWLNGSGSSGGGGGLSYFVSSTPINGYKIFWCRGGNGGQGGHYYDHNTRIGSGITHYGELGGSGGYFPGTGNGNKGSNSWNYFGSPGEGGKGYNIASLNGNKFSSNSSHVAQIDNYPTREYGYIFIQKIRE